MEHFDWNQILHLLFTAIAAYFGGHVGGSKGSNGQ